MKDQVSHQTTLFKLLFLLFANRFTTEILSEEAMKICLCELQQLLLLEPSLTIIIHVGKSFPLVFCFYLEIRRNSFVLIGMLFTFTLIMLLSR